MLTATQRKDIAPLCPHCSEAITEVYFRDLPSSLGRRFLYFCSNCHKVLGVSDKKGALMS